MPVIADCGSVISPARALRPWFPVVAAGWMTDCPLPSFPVLAEVMHLCGNDHSGGDLGRKTKTTGDGLRFLRRPLQVFAQFLRNGSGTRIHHRFIGPPM